MVMANPRLLFVYGTLMSTASGAMGRGPRARLDKASRIAGRAVAPGYLFDLGDYPGLVLTRPGTADNSGGQVFGELRELSEPDKVFRWLDHYEGISVGTEETAEYRRVVMNVVRLAEDGSEIPSSAWVYVYAGPLTGARFLPDGIWPD